MNKITIITGAKHSGKTTKLVELIKEKQKKGEKFSGFFAIGNFKNNKRHSFFLQEINSGEKKLFLSSDYIQDAEKIGRFYINNNTFDWAKNILEKEIKQTENTIVIDEIGPLELNNSGWADILRNAISKDKKIIITVRKELLKDICKKFNISEYQLIEIS